MSTDPPARPDDAERTPSGRAATEQWRALQQAVDGALDLPPEARGPYLDAACGASGEFRESVARLLEACEHAEGTDALLATPAAELAAPLLAELARHDAAAMADRWAMQLVALRAALAGRYTVEREIGRGGMATVFLAHDVRHGRPVAVKMVARDGVASAGAERFLREIRTAARLTHPNVLGVHDSGEADGLLYYVMPYIRGETLRARLRREGVLPAPDALRLLRELADALAYAHAHGVVHRDLKPENILLSEGHAVVADFGIARALAVAARDDAAPDAELATAGVVMGTPGYMAPEQTRGGAIDQRADLWALGVVAHEMLAGARPDAAPTSLAAQRPDMPPPVAALVRQLLSIDPDARPASAEAVLRLLDGDVGATRPGRAPWRRAAAVAAALVLLVAAGLLVVTSPGRRAGPRADAAAARPPAPPVPRPTADVAAYESYLRGRYILHTRNSREAIRDAIRYLEQAVARDPSFAQAHGALADAYARLGALSLGRPDEEFARAGAAARRALALDDSVAEAHVALAHILFVFDFDWVASERAFRRAITLDPSGVHARVLFALLLQDRGRVDEALAQLDTARAIDPLAPLVGVVRGRVYVNARRPAEAIRPLTEALALSPDLDLAYQQLGHAWLQLGRRAEAIAALRRAAALSGIRDSAHLAYAYAVTGDRAAARRLVRALGDSAARRYVPPFHMAMVQAGLGDADAAFAWLERGFRERGSFMDGLAVTPAFAPLHGDPRWRPLLRRMRLAP